MGASAVTRHPFPREFEAWPPKKTGLAVVRHTSQTLCVRAPTQEVWHYAYCRTSEKCTEERHYLAVEQEGQVRYDRRTRLGMEFRSLWHYDEAGVA